MMQMWRPLCAAGFILALAVLSGCDSGGGGTVSTGGMCTVDTLDGVTTVVLETPATVDLAEMNGHQLVWDDVTETYRVSGDLGLVEGDTVTLSATIAGVPVVIDGEQPSTLDVAHYHVETPPPPAVPYNVYGSPQPAGAALYVEWPIPSFPPQRVNVQIGTDLSGSSPRAVGTDGTSGLIPIGGLVAGLVDVRIPIRAENFYIFDQGGVRVILAVKTINLTDAFDVVP